MAGSANSELVVKTALAIVPPVEMWAPIQAIREHRDKAYARWPPHINLLYPFVPEEDFAEVVRPLAQALTDVPCFTVTLAEFAFFRQKKVASVYLRPTSSVDGAVNTVYRRARAAVPAVAAVPEGRPFAAHLSVGQWPNAEAERVCSTTLALEGGPITFPVNEVFLLARRGFADPFHVRAVVSLGTGKGRLITDDSYSSFASR